MTPIRAAGTLDLTVHRRDPDVAAKILVTGSTRRPRFIAPIAAEATGHAGRTVCGKPLALDELWVDYEPEPRDNLCPRCFTGGAR